MQQILDFESVIIKTLKWKITTLTFAHWGKFFTFEWDNFVNYISKYKSHFITDVPLNSLPLFNKDYNIYLQLFNIIELLTFDLNTYNYPNSLISASAVYLCILESLGYLDSHFIANKLPNDIYYIFNFYDCNLLFNDYINRIKVNPKPNFRYLPETCIKSKTKINTFRN